MNNKKQSLVSDRLKDKRRKLGITLYEVPNNANVHAKETHITETSSEAKIVPLKFYLVTNNS